MARVGSRTQAERRAATRALLLDAAGGVFAKRGYHGATLDEIARSAQLSKGAVYHHFESKEELFLALLERSLEDRLQDIAHATGPDAAGEELLANVERDSRWAPLLFEFVALAGRDPALRERFREHFLLRVRETITPLLQERFGIEDRERAEQIAIALDALGNGMILERLFDPDGVPDDLLGRAMASLVQGLGDDPGRSRLHAVPCSPAPGSDAGV
jgi:AcrR family transcriptional regulator